MYIIIFKHQSNIYSILDLQKPTSFIFAMNVSAKSAQILKILNSNIADSDRNIENLNIMEHPIFRFSFQMIEKIFHNRSTNSECLSNLHYLLDNSNNCPFS